MWANLKQLFIQEHAFKMSAKSWSFCSGLSELTRTYHQTWYRFDGVLWTHKSILCILLDPNSHMKYWPAIVHGGNKGHRGKVWPHMIVKTGNVARFRVIYWPFWKILHDQGKRTLYIWYSCPNSCQRCSFSSLGTIRCQIIYRYSDGQVLFPYIYDEGRALIKTLI